MLDAVKWSKPYKELIKLTICDQNNTEFCDDCPSESPLKECLSEIHVDGADKSSRISFKEWTTTDRAEMVNRTLTLES